MEAFGKCSLVYNNSPFLLTVRRYRQIAVTDIDIDILFAFHRSTYKDK
jgi:hypothetical protein